jgi:hypothetical protein
MREARKKKARLASAWLRPTGCRVRDWPRLHVVEHLFGCAKMSRFASVKERLDRIQLLRREIEELTIADRQGRLPGGVVCWTDRQEHERRLARMNEIRRELASLHVGKCQEG